MSFTKLDPPNHEGKTNTWLTPKEILEPLGKFDLDPCGHPNNIIATHQYYEKGLEQSWSGRVFCNPPYGKEIGKWLKKCSQHKNAIALVFARTDTKWFQDLDFVAINFLAGRIKFLKPDLSSSTNAGTPSILIAFNEENIKAISQLNGRIFIPKEQNA